MQQTINQIVLDDLFALTLKNYVINEFPQLQFLKL